MTLLHIHKCPINSFPLPSLRFLKVHSHGCGTLFYRLYWWSAHIASSYSTHNFNTQWFYSPNSNTEVSASFGCTSSDSPLSKFGHPPNMVTCVHPGPKLKAVTVWHICGCAPSGRASWGEGRNWLDICGYVTMSLLDINVYLGDLMINWLHCGQST